MFGFKEILKQRLIKTPGEWKSYRDNMIRIFERNFSSKRFSNIIDIGCGNGETTKIIANYFNINMSNTYGIDYSDSYIEQCLKSFNAIKVDLEKERLPYEDTSFDLVICNQVLEHLKNYRKVLDDLIRITRLNGYIVIGIPNLAHLINRIYLLFGIQPMCIHVNSSHVRGFTHKAFVDLLNSFEQVELIDSTGSTMYPLPYFLAMYLSNFFVGISGYTCYLLQKISLPN